MSDQKPFYLNVTTQTDTVLRPPAVEFELADSAETNAIVEKLNQIISGDNKEKGAFALAKDVTDLLRSVINPDKNVSNIKLAYITDTHIVSIKWFYQHSRHFMHVPPTCKEITTNTISQANDFSWTGVIVGTK